MNSSTPSRSARYALLLTSVAGSVLVLLLSRTEAAAQTMQPLPPQQYTTDERGVDLTTGQLNTVTTEVVIGQPGQGGLTYGRVALKQGWRDLAVGGLNCDGAGNCLVSFGGISVGFTRAGSVFTPTRDDGTTLVYNGTDYIFTSNTGTVVRMTPAVLPNTYDANVALVADITTSDDQVTTYTYATYTSGGSTWQYLQSIGNSRGYQIHYTYSNPIGPVDSVVGLNTAVDYCDPAASSCTGLTQTWPSVSYVRTPDGGGTGTNELATDQSGRQTLYHLDLLGQLDRIRRPGQSVDEIAVLRVANKVDRAFHATGEWGYVYSLGSTTAYGPNGQQINVASATDGQPTLIGNNEGNNVSYQYDADRLVSQVQVTGGTKFNFVRDGRGNILRTDYTPWLGASVAYSTYAAYPTTCTDPDICNKPTSTTDARGAVTDYSWDADHGGLLSVTSPAGLTGPRPETRISYGSVSAYVKTSPTTYGSGMPFVVPTGSTACTAGTACSGYAWETVTSINYGYGSDSPNRLPVLFRAQSGDGDIYTETAFTYDHNSDVASVNGPASGDNDRTEYIRDAARQVTMAIGPVDGAGGVYFNRATRMTYNLAGVPTLMEQGTTSSYFTPGTFSALQRRQTTYDSYLRPTMVQAQSASSVPLAVQQMSYDASGRLSCAALRMNDAVFGALPGSACTPSTQGNYGRDRITQYSYDLADRVVSSTSGMALPSAERITETVTYNVVGDLATLTDGKGNLSTLEYDGLSRLTRLAYPNASGGGSSSTDDELYAYDNNGNVTTYTDRSGQAFTTTFDALNRPVAVSATATTPAYTYTYDLLGRQLTASIPGQTIAMEWDALGRLTSQGGALGLMRMDYNFAGQVQLLRWPDLQGTVTYYNNAGDVMNIRDGNGASIITYTYDGLGRRALATRANGVTTAYGYDGISRLSTLAHNMAGTASDVTYDYAYNPASQIVSQQRSNSAYSMPAPSAGSTTTYTINGRNQITAINATSVSSDGNGNLLSDGTRTYGYDALNRLRTTGATTLNYDALGRLREMLGFNNAQYLYEGAEITGAAPSGSTTLGNRIIRGPWPDEVVVAYQSAEFTTPLWTLQDHEGSSIAITDASGNTPYALSNDEYGIPRVGNAGRLMFTGQLWLPDFGAYHYKARAYHPGLGRFLQTDPIGYAERANIYGYVGGDPVNRVDPLGLVDGCIQTATVQCAPGVTVTGRPRDREVIVIYPFLGHQGGGYVQGGRDGGGGGSGTTAREVGEDIVRIAADLICELPALGVGAGADAYRGLGVSVSGGYVFDFARARFGLAVQLGVGVGFGVNGGSQFGAMPSGGNPISVNAGFGAGGAIAGLGVSGNYNAIGTDRGFAGFTGGRAGTPTLYANVQTNAAMMTKPLYETGCN